MPSTAGRILLALGLIGWAGASRAATIFDFQFDNQGLTSSVLTTDGPIGSPVVGTGTFTSPIDLAAGTYALTSLSGFTMSFSFNNGTAFSQSNIQTPIAGVAVSITGSGATERLFFTESTTPPLDAGPAHGALDLVAGLNTLTFEPSSSGGNFAYQEFSASSDGIPGTYGRYVAASRVTATPEPASFALLATGLGALAARRRRRA